VSETENRVRYLEGFHENLTGALMALGEGGVDLSLIGVGRHWRNKWWFRIDSNTVRY